MKKGPETEQDEGLSLCSWRCPMAVIRPCYPCPPGVLELCWMSLLWQECLSTRGQEGVTVMM